jgi:hypothetical protein
MTSLHRACLFMAVLSGACSSTAPAPEQTSAPAAAAVSAWNVQVEPLALPASGRTDSPQLTPSTGGAVLSWLEHTGDFATLKYASRTESGWSPAQIVVTAKDMFLSWADVPSVLRLSSGAMVASYYPATDPSIEAYNLRLAYSKDGKSWGPTISPHSDKTTTQHGFASMFEMPDGSLGLVWLDGRDQELNTSQREGGAMGLYFASFDKSWKQTAETAVNTRVCECCQTSAAVTDDGVLTAFRDRSPREIRDINVSRLTNGSWTQARPVHVDNWMIDACPVNGPALSARGRRVATAWFTLVDENPRAFVAFSDDSGDTWSEPVRLDDESTLGHVDVELLDDGSAVATWVEFADQKSTLKVRRVERSGARSRAIEVTSARVTGYPRVVRNGRELLFAWTESAGEEGASEQVKAATLRLP